MGEIGIPRMEFLNDLRLWEIRAIIRGYHKRQYPMWRAARFVAWTTAKAFGSTKAECAEDFVQFAFEKNAPSAVPTDEEIEEIRRRIKAESE